MKGRDQGSGVRGQGIRGQGSGVGYFILTSDF